MFRTFLRSIAQTEILLRSLSLDGNRPLQCNEAAADPGFPSQTRRRGRGGRGREGLARQPQGGDGGFGVHLIFGQLIISQDVFLSDLSVKFHSLLLHVMHKF